MGNRAVASKIDIPAVFGFIQIVGCHVFPKQVETFLALAASYDFSDTGDEKVHRRDGFPIIVFTHVERFDFLWVVENRRGTLEMRFGQVAFVL